jgi:hypothetical protein
MAEFEELRIVVSLTDQASTGFNSFKKSISEFTSGQPAQHLENFKRHNTLLTQLLKATGLEATGTSKAFIDLTSKFALSAGVIGALGYALYKTTSIVADAAKGIVDQANKLKALGIPYSEGRNIIEQYALVNIEANKTIEDIQAANQLQFEARKAHHSEMFDQLRQLVFNDPYVKDFQIQLQNAKTQVELQNVIVEGQEKFSELSNKYYHSDDEATQKRTNAQTRARFRAIVGLNEEFDRAVRIKEIDKDRAASLEKLNTEAQKFTRLWNETAVNLERIGGVLEGAAIQQLLPLLQSAKDLTGAIFQLVTEGFSALKDKNFWESMISGADVARYGGYVLGGPGAILGGVATEAIRNRFKQPSSQSPSNFGLDQAQPFLGIPGGTENDKINDNTRELKRLNDNLYILLHPEVMKNSGTVSPASQQVPIPGLQHGGIVTKPTIAMIGEAGPEAVVPLPRGRPIGLGGDPAVAWQELHDRLIKNPNEAGALSYSERPILPGEKGMHSEMDLMTGPGMFPGGGSIYQHLKDVEKGMEMQFARPNADDYVSTNPRFAPHDLRLQHGGIVDKPTTALIGEAGPEAVIPLRDARARYAAEMLKDPALRDRFISFAEAETGGQGRGAAQAWMESTLNRAASRDQTLSRALSSGSGYWPPRTLGIGAQTPTDKQRDYYDPGLEYALGGSNISRLATGNASSSVGFAGGPETSRVVSSKGKTLERFGTEGRDIGWANRERIAISLQDVRSTIDTASRSPDIEAAGHIKVQVGESGGRSTPLETLFKPVPEEQKVQMTPASVGPSERTRSAPPSLANR